jgi:hypothetical protein
VLRYRSSFPPSRADRYSCCEQRAGRLVEAEVVGSRSVGEVEDATGRAASQATRGELLLSAIHPLWPPPKLTLFRLCPQLSSSFAQLGVPTFYRTKNEPALKKQERVMTVLLGFLDDEQD